MPIYEYKCGKCGRISLLLENSGSRPNGSCLHCGSKKLKRQISTFALGIKEGNSKRCHGCSDQSCPHLGYEEF